MSCAPSAPDSSHPLGHLCSAGQGQIRAQSGSRRLGGHSGGELASWLFLPSPASALLTVNPSPPLVCALETHGHPCCLLSVVPQNETAMAAELVSRGPLSILIDASGLQFYHKGVWDPFYCGSTINRTDHAVLLTGYGVAESGALGNDGAEPYWVGLCLVPLPEAPYALARFALHRASSHHPPPFLGPRMPWTAPLVRPSVTVGASSGVGRVLCGCPGHPPTPHECLPSSNPFPRAVALSACFWAGL